MDRIEKCITAVFGLIGLFMAFIGSYIVGFGKPVVMTFSAWNPPGREAISTVLDFHTPFGSVVAFIGIMCLAITIIFIISDQENVVSKS